MISSATVLCTLLSVVTLHEFVLRRYEVDHLVLPIVAISGTAYCISIYKTSLSDATSIAAVFWTSLWLYIGVYRTFFHPLKHYPGPFAARLSKFWVIKQVLGSGGHLHWEHQRLQKEYGDYVRTGPRELSIFDPAAISPILGSQSKTTKSPYYDIFERSLNLNRDKPWHRQRRKIWDNAMKTSLSGYAPRIEEFTNQLLTRIKAERGKPVPLSEFMSHYSYDISADVAFGAPMGFTNGDAGPAANSFVNAFEQGLRTLGVMYHLPWILSSLSFMNNIAGPMKHWTDYTIAQADKRIARVDAPMDLMSHLILNTPKTHAGRKLLHGESRLIISAGSETTATTLTLVFVMLATHPEYLHAIRKEFRDSKTTYHCERPLPLIDAVAAETMRLWPPVLFASPRVTPPQGLNINGHFVPGNMIVQIPSFVLHRDPRNYVRPDEFIPERWTTKPELILNRDAYMPFLTGPYACAGRGLAQMELRSVIGRVVNEYDVRMPEGFVADEYWSAVTECFTSRPPKQDIKFVSVGT